MGKVILSKLYYAERKNQEPKFLRRCVPTTPLWKRQLERQILLRDRGREHPAISMGTGCNIIKRSVMISAQDQAQRGGERLGCGKPFFTLIQIS